MFPDRQVALWAAVESFPDYAHNTPDAIINRAQAFLAWLEAEATEEEA